MSSPSLDASEEHLCLTLGSESAEFFAGQTPTGPLESSCPLALEGARNLAQANGISPAKLDLAAAAIHRAASARWLQLRRTRELDEQAGRR